MKNSCDQTGIKSFLNLVINATNFDAVLNQDQESFLRTWLGAVGLGADMTKFQDAAILATWINTCH